MADSKVSKKVAGFELAPVTAEYGGRGAANREAPWVKVTRTGYAQTNTEGTNVVISNLGAFGLEGRQNLKFAFGANPKTGLVGIYLSDDDTQGGQGVRDADTILYFHLGGVFKQHPTLRPSTTVVCGLSFAEDAQGKPCFIFNVRQGVTASTRRTKSGEAEPQKQLAPGEQAPAKPEPEAGAK